jgi:uncharacterized protein (TIGR00290 family)
MSLPSSTKKVSQLPAIPILMSWSGGKDCYLALNALRQDPQYEVVELVSSVCRETGCVGIHEVRRELIRQQAASLGLPLAEIDLPSGASNQAYESAWEGYYAKWVAAGVTRVGFGDLFVEDIRAYREQFLTRLGLSAVFPLWGRSTSRLAADAIASGMQAVLCSCDAERLGAQFVGRMFDRDLLNDLPAGCDPCGENGEFHTFVFDGPGFSQPIPWQQGEVCRRGSVDFCDLLPVQHG